MRERDLFRAIVLSGAALAAAPGCSNGPAPVDAGGGTDAPVAIDAPSGDDAPAEVDTGVLVADAGGDAGTTGDAGGPDDAGDENFDAGEDAMVLIL